MLPFSRPLLVWAHYGQALRATMPVSIDKRGLKNTALALVGAMFVFNPFSHVFGVCDGAFFLTAERDSISFAELPPKAPAAECEAPPSASKLPRSEITMTRFRTINAVNWGEPIANPFTSIGPSGRDSLASLGIDLKQIGTMSARLISGKYLGAATKNFSNRDRNIILVFGPSFATHGKIKSAGPILALEHADFAGTLEGAGLVWLAEGSASHGGIHGHPVISGLDNDKKFGWQRPPDFLKHYTELSQFDHKHFNTHRLCQQEALRKLVLQARGIDVGQVAKHIANPIRSIPPAGLSKFKGRGLSPDRLRNLKARLLKGHYYGDKAPDFINQDEDTILVLDKDFHTHGNVFSMGPVIATGHSSFTGKLIAADLIWFVDNSFPRGEVVGIPVIFDNTADHSQIKVRTEDLWHGDFGWPRSSKP